MDATQVVALWGTRSELTTVLASVRTACAAVSATVLSTHETPGGLCVDITAEDAASLTSAFALALPQRRYVLQDAALYEARRLFAFDVDGTLVRGESLDALARAWGQGEAVAALTSRAMAGGMAFEESLRARLDLLRGCPLELVQATASSQVLTLGARELCQRLTAAGHHLVVVSGGFHELLDPVLAALPGITVTAHRFEVDTDGRLTGNVDGPVVSAETKRDVLRQQADAVSMDISRCVAVGDGANDRLMFAEAGISVAFQASALVQEAASAVLNGPRIDSVLGLVPAGRFATSASRRP